MLYGAKTWALTGKLEDILKNCDSRMLRYMTRSVEFSGRNGRREKESRKTKENVERYSEEGFGTTWSG